MSVKRWGWLLLAVVGLALAACSDDAGDGDASSLAGQCSGDETWNPVLGQCQLPARPANNAGPDNGGGSTDTNNGGGPTETNNGGGPTTCGPGEILGLACAPSGDRLAAADVTLEGVDCDGNPFTLTTHTGSDGTFSFTEVPSGTHTLTVSTGSFNNERTVIVRDGQTTDLTGSAEKLCVNSNVDIAVISGSYDHVEGILDGLNLDYDIKGSDGGSGLLGPSDTAGLNQSKAFLSSPTELAGYDIVFINCGRLWSYLSGAERTAIVDALRGFVQGGGSLYASDWAAPFMEQAFPVAIDFYGDDADFDQARNGYAPQTITATVGTNALQTTLSRGSVDIEFPHSPPFGPVNNNWAIATSADATAQVHLSGPAQLCGNSNCSSAGQTQADTPLLITYDTAGGGRAIFTSFHNEHQGGVSDDMELILRFLILQL